jgi:hypothetical protein
MGDVATFVTLGAAGSPPRQTLNPVRWPGIPSWAGSPGRREGSIDLTPCTETSAVPSGEEPNDRLGATSPPRKMAIAMMEQRSHGDPGDRGGMGAPAVHRFCADAVAGYCRKRTPGRPPGSSGIPPATPPHGPGGIETRLARGGGCTPAQLAILGNAPLRLIV